MGKEVYEEPLEEYRNYLNRVARTSSMSLWELHQLLMSRLIAMEYGVTEEQLVWLDENL